MNIEAKKNSKTLYIDVFMPFYVYFNSHEFCIATHVWLKLRYITQRRNIKFCMI